MTELGEVVNNIMMHSFQVLWMSVLQQIWKVFMDGVAEGKVR